MKYYKIIENEKLTMICTGNTIPDSGLEITEIEYNQLLTQIQEHVKLVEEYVDKVKSGVITIEEVPEEFRAEVEAIINQPEPEEPNNPYGLPNGLYNEVEQGVVNKIEAGVNGSTQEEPEVV